MVVYTHGTWHVEQGHEEAFEAAWVALGDTFRGLVRPPVSEGTLLRRTDRPGHYVSFGAWPDREAVAAMRADRGVQEAIDELVAHCLLADPAMYDVVRVVPPGAGARV